MEGMRVSLGETTRRAKTLRSLGIAVLPFLGLASFAGTARAQQLPEPNAFIPWVDLKCYRAVETQPAPPFPLRLRQLNPLLAASPERQVVVQSIEELCVPVRKLPNPPTLIPNPPAPDENVLAFLRYVDLACYGIQSADGAPLELPANLQALRLTHINPIIEKLFQGIPGVLPPQSIHELVRLGPARQLCVPVSKRLGATEAVPPPAVLALIRHIDLECFDIIQSPGPVTAPLALFHLNPLLANFPPEQTSVLRPRRACFPVAKNGQIPPPEILRLVREIDIKKYQFGENVGALNATLDLRHLNPVVSQFRPLETARILEAVELGLPVRKTLPTIAPALPPWGTAAFAAIVSCAGLLALRRARRRGTGGTDTGDGASPKISRRNRQA